MTRRAVLIHGWGGSPEEGWRPWLKSELEKRGFVVNVPEMPDTKHPRINAWLGKLIKTIGTPDKELYLIGHSLGCITILRYLETLSEGQKIGGAVLVAGFSDLKITVDKNEDITEIRSFFDTEVDFEKAKVHCKKFVAIHSDNDPYVAVEYANIFKEKLGAEIIVEHGMKHFSGDDGIKKLTSSLNSVAKMADK
jgi:uncharacterized protein